MNSYFRAGKPDTVLKMNMPGEYDAIVIGTGAGGGTLALHLAQAGKNILILERGPFMPQEKLNWDTSAVFLDDRYHTKEIWQDKDGKPLHPQQAYFVGGQTKVYGAAMFRMRAEDFGVIQHKGGISPAWPITYADMETSIPLHAYFKKRIPLEGVGHQNGTCRMGTDTATSVLDPHCKAHDLDNLYVVDASCFVSASAVNPSLTIIANAIRVADHLLAERLN